MARLPRLRLLLVLQQTIDEVGTDGSDAPTTAGARDEVAICREVPFEQADAEKDVHSPVGGPFDAPTRSKNQRVKNEDWFMLKERGIVVGTA